MGKMLPAGDLLLVEGDDLVEESSCRLGRYRIGTGIKAACWLVLIAAVAASCATAPVDEDATFLTRSGSGDQLDGLAFGRVQIGGDGCVTLDLEYAPFRLGVIWPNGSSLQSDGMSIRLGDGQVFADGDLVKIQGGSVRLDDIEHLVEGSSMNEASRSCAGGEPFLAGEVDHSTGP